MNSPPTGRCARLMESTETSLCTRMRPTARSRTTTYSRSALVILLGHSSSLRVQTASLVGVLRHFFQVWFIIPLLDLGNAPFCGNKQIEEGEQCDCGVNDVNATLAEQQACANYDPCCDYVGCKVKTGNQCRFLSLSFFAYALHLIASSLVLWQARVARAVVNSSEFPW